jgi:hypothetical protein
MFPVIRFFILIGMALSPVVFAQGSDESSSADKKKTGRRTWIVATSLPEGVKSPVTILAGGELSEVRLSKRSVGTSIKVPKDGLIQVVNPTVSADGETTYEILASLTIPDGVKDSLGILVPVPKLTPPLLFKSKIIDLDKFRGGSALFVNLTNLEIGVILGSKKKTIKTGRVEIIDGGDFSGSKSLAVSYHYRSPKEDKWNLISASTVPLRSSLREILIFSYNAELDQIGYHGMSFHVNK